MPLLRNCVSCTFSPGLIPVNTVSTGREPIKALATSTMGEGTLNIYFSGAASSKAVNTVSTARSRDSRKRVISGGNSNWSPIFDLFMKEGITDPREASTLPCSEHIRACRRNSNISRNKIVLGWLFGHAHYIYRFTCLSVDTPTTV